MQWNQYLLGKSLVLIFQRTRVSADHWTQNFEKLGQTIVLLFFVGDEKKQIHHLGPDVRAKHHVFSIDSMQNGLKVITLTWVLRVEQLKKTAYKALRNILSHYFIWYVTWHHEFQEKFINQLKMRPCLFKVRLVFVRVDLLVLFIVWKNSTDV